MEENVFKKNIYIYTYIYLYKVAQMVKNPPEVQDTWVQSLGQEDPLEKKMATHFSRDLMALIM